MTVKAAAQQTLIDMTDAYSVFLTSEAYTFPGTTSGAVNGSSCTTSVLVYRGDTQMIARLQRRLLLNRQV